MAFWITLSAVLLAFTGVYAWSALRRARLNVTGWTHVGIPPAGTDVALRVIESLAPGLQAGGTIEWVPEPFLVGDVLAAGVMFSARPVHVRVEWWSLVEVTALAHEIGHAWRRQRGLSDGDGDPEFAEWVKSTNRAIADALSGLDRSYTPPS